MFSPADVTSAVGAPKVVPFAVIVKMLPPVKWLSSRRLYEGNVKLAGRTNTTWLPSAE